jgi:hypothetical protein
MATRLSLAFSFVIAVTTIALEQSGNTVAQSLDVTDPEALRIYAALIPAVWAGRSKDVIVVQRETDDIRQLNRCDTRFVPSPDPEWAEIRKAYSQENAQRKVLPLALPLRQPYLVMTMAQLERMNAPIILAHPENYNEWLPPYIVVSAIGFNAAKTKALVSVRLPDQGREQGMELRNGQWETASNSSICTWIA